jgi:hypothetical protein
VDHVPVHVGADTLKIILYNAIIPKWNAWTNYFPLHIDQIIMRDKLWVILEPTAPDRDAISKHFFKPGKKGQIFKTGKTLIHFHIPNKVYAAMLTKQADDELEAEQKAVTRNKKIKCSPSDGADFSVCGFIKLQAMLD